MLREKIVRTLWRNESARTLAWAVGAMLVAIILVVALRM
ncbi:hypothetical protein SAMN05414137_11313 [Streptacidiphilus jiangxiensis]|uniref:Uncharacterized protein n=1 Tax=Streptacidiphilus jiangxiensis TaxID=235985 RepID=A0A1H7T1S1_STRJI|nr:hypothetical protein SAMN05414137_11313 [Streptacidiphilus jiangxiensis]